MVERALHGQGLRFGTDGTPGALFAYVRARHRLVAPSEARSGDLVFFNLAGSKEDCGDHVGLVEAVDRDGRLTFSETRGGLIRRSYVSWKDPRARRDSSGAVVNSFLRAKRIDDPPDARYFAGEMLCAVGRVSPGG